MKNYRVFNRTENYYLVNHTISAKISNEPYMFEDVQSAEYYKNEFADEYPRIVALEVHEFDGDSFVRVF